MERVKEWEREMGMEKEKVREKGRMEKELDGKESGRLKTGRKKACQ